MRAVRLELTTYGLGNRCSVHLSYARQQKHLTSNQINCQPKLGLPLNIIFQPLAKETVRASFI